jgi:pullulanase/glycogen debranching enzyme
MVKALHAAGLEVILDVVFNHTAEGGEGGPSLCFRGLDNTAYYRLNPGHPDQYYDTTGTGNSLNAGNTVALRLIMDSLRYWLTEMHVDGFRFDLAATLARQYGGFSSMSAFFDLVAQDPVVSQAKLIAEPWDVGQMDSYDLGRFPAPWREWNGKYRDGTDDNRSWNCGAEGPTIDPEVLALRARQSRAMLTTLLLSFGVPMLLGGDELGRTQAGNNNAYCQDNEISWFDWSAVDSGLLSFTRKLVSFRRSHPVFRRRRFLSGIEAAELGWFTPAGTPMTQADWSDANALALGVYLDGSDAPDTGPDGQPMLDDDFLVLVNAWWEPLAFTVPAARTGQTWETDIDSFDPVGSTPRCQAGDQVTVGPRSVVVLRGPRAS